MSHVLRVHRLMKEERRKRARDRVRVDDAESARIRAELERRKLVEDKIDKGDRPTPRDLQPASKTDPAPPPTTDEAPTDGAEDEPTQPGELGRST